jgi:hypothetical protein
MRTPAPGRAWITVIAFSLGLIPACMRFRVS